MLSSWVPPESYFVSELFGAPRPLRERGREGERGRGRERERERGREGERERGGEGGRGIEKV